MIVAAYSRAADFSLREFSSCKGLGIANYAAYQNGNCSSATVR